MAFDLAMYPQALAPVAERQLESITMEVQVDGSEVLIDWAVSLGLAVNEVIVNRVTYASEDDHGGAITVLLMTGVSQGDASLIIPNNGWTFVSRHEPVPKLR